MFVGHPNFQANQAKNIGAITEKVPWGIIKKNPEDKPT